jgi:hypothetical protein
LIISSMSLAAAGRALGAWPVAVVPGLALSNPTALPPENDPLPWLANRVAACPRR